MKEDIFKEVSHSDLPTILKILEKDWTANFLLHQYLTTMAHNLYEKTQIAQVLFCFGNFENGVYLIESKFKLVKGLSFFFVYTLANDLLFLKRALLKTNRIPWKNSGSYIFEVTMNRFTPTICEVFIAKRVKFLFQHYILMRLPSNVKVNPKDIPVNYFLDYLNETHAEEIDRHWPSFIKQREVLESEISTQFGLGVFRKDDKKLLSYALCFHSGGIFMLYSDLSIRRKGFAEIIARNIICEIRRKGWIPFCTVFPDNIPSMNLLKKIGFVDIGSADFIFPFQFINITN